jgi:hypothetical protein
MGRPRSRWQRSQLALLLGVIDGRQYARYELPSRLTASGRRAVAKAVPDFLADLAAIMDRNTDHAAELTDRDVEAGLNALGRGRLRAVPPPPGSAATRRNTVGPVLAAVGTTGTTVTSPFLHSPLQIAVFAVLVLIGPTGLVLAWLRPTRTDMSS